MLSRRAPSRLSSVLRTRLLTEPDKRSRRTAQEFSSPPPPHTPPIRSSFPFSWVLSCFFIFCGLPRPRAGSCTCGVIGRLKRTLGGPRFRIEASKPPSLLRQIEQQVVPIRVRTVLRSGSSLDFGGVPQPWKKKRFNCLRFNLASQYCNCGNTPPRLAWENDLAPSDVITCI